jgi:hypothetical protein
MLVQLPPMALGGGWASAIVETLTDQPGHQTNVMKRR